MPEGLNVAISYKFTGVNPEELQHVSSLSVLIGRRVDSVFCSLDLEDEFRGKGMNPDEIYQYCLERFDNCNAVVAYIAHEQRSTGMQMELQKAKDKNMAVYLIVRRGLVFQDFRDVALQVIEFDDISELTNIIDSLNFLRK